MAILNEILHTFLQASPYILLGLFFSGLVQSLIPKEKITAWMGQNNLRSVLISAAAGIPMPLCSCGVIPMAVSLRQNGASRGATVSFLIATPETGLDSIMLSFALLNPVMAIFRPIAAFVTAILAGVMENVLGKEVQPTATKPKDCCCTGKKLQQGWKERLVQGFKHSFVTLLADLAPWLILGLVLSGIISYAVPSSFIEKFLGGGMGSMILMLLVGIPLYICASASTPIAASLLLKGASPGAALVFLLVGPATNATTMLMVYRFLGLRALIIYLASIALCALGFGILLNSFYSGMDIRHTIGGAAHCVGMSMQIAAAIILAILMIYALAKEYFK
ncbi:MAG: SO_0444 family Cu/Zn efflux transporter [Candidatus Omnitrophota bacterium]